MFQMARAFHPGECTDEQKRMETTGIEPATLRTSSECSPTELCLHAAIISAHNWKINKEQF